MNPIKYSELIQNDVGSGFEELAKTLKNIKSNYDGLAKSVNEQTARLSEGLKALNPATPEGQAAMVSYARQIEELEKKVKSLEAAQKQYKKTQREVVELDRLATESKLRRKEMTLQLNQAVKAGAMTQAQENEIMEKAKDETKLQTLSINELNYAMNKLISSYRNMTAVGAEAVAEREKQAMSIKRLKDQLNVLNQAIGNHTGSVGNYAKSWNGLNIAFQQIVRETPNMAMGFNTFFLAISNNIPILTDQIKLAQEKYKADMKQIEVLEALGGREKDIADIRKNAVPVGKQILSSLFSWQTALLAGVTLLTMFGGKLIESLQAWIKSRKAIDGAAMALEAYNKALSDTSMEGAKASAQLNLLYKEATDLNASMEDRLGAVKDLKNLYPDIFEGLETEAILAGDAKEQYDLLADSIYRTAMAEAAYSKIADVASREVEQRLKQQELNRRATEQGFLGVSDMAMYSDEYMTRSNGYGGYYTVSTITSEQRKMIDEYKDVEKALADIRTERDAIQKMMEDNDLFGFLKANAGGGRKGSTKAETVDDLYWEAMSSIIGGMNEGLQKEIASLTAAYAQQQESFKEKEAELIALLQSSDEAIVAEAEIQLKNLQVLVASAENNYQAERTALVQKMLESYAEEVADEGNIEEQVRKRIETELKVERELMTSEMYMLFEQKKITQEELNEKLARINNDYWYAYAQQLKAMGDIQGYNDAMGRIKESGGEDEGPFAQWLKDHGVSRKYLKDLERAAKLTIGYIGDIIDAYHELAEAAVRAAEKQVESAQKVYEAELGAYENGYANNVEYARKELALRKEQLAKAAEQEKRYARMQQQVESAQQAVTLASTIAYLFRDASKVKGILGLPLAIAASTAMVAAFTASKAMVSKATRMKDTIEYGEGMHEYLDYGGSHASGNDIDFGVGKDGRRRRVERGEMVAVFNRRNTDKYGATALGNLVDSINKGTFEQEYLGIFGGPSGGNGVIVMNSFPSSVSDDISAIRKSTESQRYSAGNGTIVEKYRNRTRIIHLN